jgi:hypothetical protein
MFHVFELQECPEHTVQHYLEKAAYDRKQLIEMMAGMLQWKSAQSAEKNGQERCKKVGDKRRKLQRSWR